MAENEVVRYGAMITLKNDLYGNYIDTHGRVNKEVVDHFIDPQIQGLVSTHESDNRYLGSGSWQILSAGTKQIGEIVEYGHRIHLRNLLTGDYLDAFEFATQLPLVQYLFTERSAIGVFTTKPSRKGHWTIGHATGQTGAVVSNDLIHLYQKWHGDRYLFAHAADTAEIKQYDQHQHLVFTQPDLAAEDRSKSWRATLTPNHPNSYYLWGKIDNRWIDFGTIQYEGLPDQIIAELDLNFDDDEPAFRGTVNLEPHGEVNISGDWDADSGSYDASFFINHSRDYKHVIEALPKKNWRFSTYAARKIKSIKLESANNGQTLTGHITLAGRTVNEQLIEVKGIRATPALAYAQQNTLLNNFFSGGLWTSRNEKMRKVLESAKQDLQVVFTELALLDQITHDPDNNFYPYIQEWYRLEQWAGWLSDQTPDATIQDANYQISQLLNIHTFWVSMQAFWDKLSDTSAAAIEQLQQAGFHPPVHRIRRAIKRLTIDFEILQAAIQQRSSIGKGADVSHFQANSLVVTDKLADLAIAPCQHLIVSSDSEKVIPITYFSKSIHIRQLPYSDQFVLVGLTYDLVSNFEQTPSSATSNALFELMAIPHEVGHFMYRHADLTVPKTLIQGAQPTVQKGYEKNVARYEEVSFAEISESFREHAFYPWMEEIFADLYGCFVAGPLAVIGFQAILATEDSERIMMDDELHPTPVLRPYILSEMLRILHEADPKRYPFTEIADSLDANWTAIIERLGFIPEDIDHGRPARIMIPDQDGSYFEDLINVRTLVKKSRLILRLFTHILLENADMDALNHSHAPDNPDCQIPWCGSYNSIADYIPVMKNLIEEPMTTAKEAIAHLAKKYKLAPQLEDKIDKFMFSVDEDLLESWHDSGPTGSSRGGSGFT